jgi:plastocyanin domain-containing protein
MRQTLRTIATVFVFAVIINYPWELAHSPLYEGMGDFSLASKLPLNEPVTVEFTPRKGELTFACGMDMIKGKLIVE